MQQDKMAIMQVLAGILHNPALLSETDRYQIESLDFPERFHSIVFGAINNLYHSGTETIDEVEIDGFLKDYGVQYEIFNQNEGLRYIEKLKELYEDGKFKKENFDYYYERVKKFTLIREMEGLGFDVTEVYDDSLLDATEREGMMGRFDELSIENILAIYEAKMIEIKEKFEADSEARGIHAAEGIDELLAKLEKSPDIGLPLNSEMMASAARGARKQKFYLRSSYSGGGKTRTMIADGLRLSAKGWYDSEKDEWVKNEFNESSVVISTEMTFEELQTPAIAYIADVEEHKILLNRVTDEERERIWYAANILKSSNIYFEHLPNFDVKDIERTIVKNIIKNDVGYVFFDYIHSSINILSSFSRASGINLREDQILLLMADSLKAIANKHDVFLMSATQLNDRWKEAWRKGEQIDFEVVRGSKAIVDKVDFFAVMLPLSKKEKEETLEIVRSLGSFNGVKPNLVTHISKNRGNRHTSIKIFSYIDMGTMRIKDLFACDVDNSPVTIEKLVIENSSDEEA